jgi:nucleoid-associated protein YgaU
LAKLETENKDSNPKSAFSAIAAGILVIVAGFLVYNYFSKTSQKSGNLISKIEQQVDKIGQGESKESVTEDKAQGTGSATEVAGAETDKPVNQSAWQANDISSNSLTGESYTVKYGDTLWEISDGRYGTGFNWGKIRDANLDKIGFLPSGSQALIFAGQVLTLPN